MAWTRYPRVVPRDIDRRGLGSDCRWVRLLPRVIDLTLPPIISFHGFSTGGTADVTLEAFVTASQTTGFPYDALLATKRAVWLCFTGDNFGHETDVGTAQSHANGLEVVAAALTDAAALGFDTTKADLIGGSMGATNAINYAIRHDATVRNVYLYVPGLDFGSIWDLAGAGAIRDALLAVFGGSDKATMLAASADYDPVRLTLPASIANRTMAYISDPDLLIDPDSAAAWLDAQGVTYVTGASNHFTLDDAAFDEYAVLSHLARS